MKMSAFSTAAILLFALTSCGGNFTNEEPNRTVKQPQTLAVTPEEKLEMQTSSSSNSKLKEQGVPCDLRMSCGVVEVMRNSATAVRVSCNFGVPEWDIWVYPGNTSQCWKQGGAPFYDMQNDADGFYIDQSYRCTLYWYNNYQWEVVNTYLTKVDDLNHAYVKTVCW